MPKPTTYGDIIAAARLALAQDLPEHRIVGLLRKAVGVTCRNPYKPEAEKKTADMRAYRRSYYNERKARGLCVKCGQDNDRIALAVTCSKCFNSTHR